MNWNVYLFIAAFFSVNMTVDSFKDEVKAGTINKTWVLAIHIAAKLTCNAIIFPWWLMRIIWNTIFEDKK